MQNCLCFCLSYILLNTKYIYIYTRSYKTAPRPRCGLNFFYLRLYIQTNQKRTVSSRFSALRNFTTKHNLGAGNLTKIFVTLPFPNKENTIMVRIVSVFSFPNQPKTTVKPRLSALARSQTNHNSQTSRCYQGFRNFQIPSQPITLTKTTKVFGRPGKKPGFYTTDESIIAKANKPTKRRSSKKCPGGFPWHCLKVRRFVDVLALPSGCVQAICFLFSDHQIRW